MESTAAGTRPDRIRETTGGCYTTAAGQGASGGGGGPRKSIQAGGTTSAAICRNNLANLGNRAIAESAPANRTTTARARCLYKLRYHPLKCRQPKQRLLASTTGRTHGSLRLCCGCDCSMLSFDFRHSQHETTRIKTIDTMKLIAKSAQMNANAME